MFFVALRKMIKNKWLVACLFLGCLLSVALFTSLPTYSRGVLQRMIYKEFETRQTEKNVFPMILRVRRNIRPSEEGEDALLEYDTFVEETIFGDLQLPTLQRFTQHATSNIMVMHVSRLDDIEYGKQKRGAFIHAQDLEEHVELVAGRFPAAEKTADGYEIMISERMMFGSQMMLDSKYRAAQTRDAEGVPIEMKVVGVFRHKDLTDPYWSVLQGSENFFFNGEAFERLIRDINVHTVTTKAWGFVLDYTQLKIDDIDRFYEIVKARTTDRNSDYNVSLVGMDVLESFFVKREEINLFMWVLLVPIIALLAFYIVMITNLIYDHDRSEIALMKSRGAGRGKVFLLYVWQSLILSALALAVGIPLGMGICNMLGSANGFLQFVGRSPLEISLGAEGLRYSLAGVGLFLFSMLIPVLLAKDGSIVVEKRRKAARRSKPFYERTFLDLILLAVSVLGFNFYESISMLLTQAGLKASEVPVNPLLFLISTLFVFGCGLLFSRLYPYLVRLVFRLGKNRWPPALYASLIGASRARSRTRFLIVFLVMTVSLGIFSSVAARTINQNREDRIRYAVGADIRMEELWHGIDPNPEYDAMGMPIQKPPQDLLYTEPSFAKFLDLEGVEVATRGYRNTRAVLSVGGGTVRNATVMALEPDKFSSAAWSRGDMYGYHLNHMMNALMTNPYTVLLSESVMKEMEIKSGDTVAVTWKNNTAYLQCVLYDRVKYFPTFDSTEFDSEGKERNPALVVMNYNLIRDMFRLEPYEIWIKCAPGTSVNRIIEQIEEKNIVLQSFADTTSQISKMHADPMIQGMNGNLTLSFLITIVITATGFMIFWIIDLKSRQLQLGIIRSLGMTERGVTAMLLWEQLLLSVIPMLAGLGIGYLAAVLFVPMFEFGVVAAETVPPFKVMLMTGDFVRVIVIAAVTIFSAILVLATMVSRMKISQTLKLGED